MFKPSHVISGSTFVHVFDEFDKYQRKHSVIRENIRFRRFADFIIQFENYDKISECVIEMSFSLADNKKNFIIRLTNPTFNSVNNFKIDKPIYDEKNRNKKTIINPHKKFQEQAYLLIVLALLVLILITLTVFLFRKHLLRYVTYALRIIVGKQNQRKKRNTFFKEFSNQKNEQSGLTIKIHEISDAKNRPNKQKFDRNEVANVESSVEELAEEKERLKVEINEIKSINSDLVYEIKKIKEKFVYSKNELERHNSDLKKQNELHENNVKKLNVEIDYLTDKINFDKVEIEQERNNLINEINALIKEKEDIVGENKLLKEEDLAKSKLNEKLENENISLNENLKELKNKLSKLQEENIDFRIKLEQKSIQQKIKKNKDGWINQVSNGKTGKVVKSILAYSKEKKLNNSLKSIVNISNRLKRLMMEKNNGTISKDQFNLEINNINSTLIDLILSEEFE